MSTKLRQHPTATTTMASTSLPSSPLKLSCRTNRTPEQRYKIFTFADTPTLISPTTPSSTSTSSYCLTSLSKMQPMVTTSSQRSTRSQTSSLKSSQSSSPMSRQPLHFHRCINSDCVDHGHMYKQEEESTSQTRNIGSVRAISRRFATEDGSGSIECTSYKHSLGRAVAMNQPTGYSSQRQLVPDEPVLPPSFTPYRNNEEYRAKNSSSPFTYIETTSVMKKQPTTRRNVYLTSNLDEKIRSPRSTPVRSVSFKLDKVSPRSIIYLLLFIPHFTN